MKKLFIVPLIGLAAFLILMAFKKGGSSGAKTEGVLYMQTNGIKNEIIQYARMNDGSLNEVERIPTGGAGSGTYKPIYDHPNDPNAFEGAKSIILTPDHKWLCTTNGGNNSVSSFKVADDGKLTFMDVQVTGQPVAGKSGTAKSLAYAENSHTLYVLHSFGPDHIRMFSVNNGMLTQKPGSYTANIGDKHRVATEIVLTPDNKFLLVNNLFDQMPGIKPDGSPMVVVSNMVDKDGLVVFPVNLDGTLGAAIFQDAGGAAGFDLAFLHGSNTNFINSYAGSNGIAMCNINAAGKVTCSPVVMINQQIGQPSELCWLQISPDNKLVYAVDFGFSYISSFKIDNGIISVLQDPASEAVPGDGKFKALDKVTSSGPNDNWLSPDGKYYYQIYPNASKLISYKTNENGKLTKIDTEDIPYTSPQGLAGF